jgi:hypothetical protein
MDGKLGKGCLDGIFVLYYECFYKLNELFEEGLNEQFIYIFHKKILNMWLTHGPTKSTFNKYKGFCKMPKTKVHFLVALS